MSNEKAEVLKVNGKAMYAKVFQPSTPAPDNEYGYQPEWTIDVLVNRQERQRLESKGIIIRDNNDKYKLLCEDQDLNSAGFDGSYVKVKKSTIKKVYDQDAGEVKKDAKGNPLTEAAARPRVVDTKGTEIPEDADLKIGNLSDVEVTATVTKPRLPNGQPKSSGFGLRLLETKILNLVEFKPKETGSFVFGADEVKHGEALEESEMPF